MDRRVALLVAASGGHLEQLTRLEPLLTPPFDDVVYVTSSSEQSRSLLQDRSVCFVPAVPPRGWRPALLALAPAYRLIRERRVTDVVSTGSGIAVPYLLAARGLHRNAHYIESAARTFSPSLSGRIVQHIPGIRLYSQYPWASEAWQYRGSVFDGFRSISTTASPAPARRVVVTLGTMSGYPFHRAVRAVLRVLSDVTAADCEVLWQLGDTPVPGRLPGRTHAALPATELRAAIEEADVVIAHAGTGSSLQILDSGRAPVLLPRSSAHGEHVDDHQRMIAQALHHRGLAVSADPDHLDPAHVLAAMGRRVERDHHVNAFRLVRELDASPQEVE